MTIKIMNNLPTIFETISNNQNIEKYPTFNDVISIVKVIEFFSNNESSNNLFFDNLNKHVNDFINDYHFDYDVSKSLLKNEVSKPIIQWLETCVNDCDEYWFQVKSKLIKELYFNMDKYLIA